MFRMVGHKPSIDDVEVARRAFTVRPSDAFTPAKLGTDAIVHVLPTSTATVTTPGRPERVLGLSGWFEGWTAGKLNPAFDFDLRLGDALGRSAITVTSLVTDPLCSAPAVATTAPLHLRTSKQQLSALDYWSTVSQRVGQPARASAVLAFDADATVFAGCAGPPTGSTTISFDKVALTAKGLSDIALTGTISDVAVGAGAMATVTLTLHLSVAAAP